MKKITILAFMALLTTFSFAQKTVPLDSIAKYEGKTVTVCAKVLGTHLTTGDKKTTYLNFGQPFPNSTFTVVIFESDLPNFKYAPSEFLKDKNVCITGKVEMFKGKPEIIAKKEDQIKVQ